MVPRDRGDEKNANEIRREESPAAATDISHVIQLYSEMQQNQRYEGDGIWNRLGLSQAVLGDVEDKEASEGLGPPPPRLAQMRSGRFSTRESRGSFVPTRRGDYQPSSVGAESSVVIWRIR